MLGVPGDQGGPGPTGMTGADGPPGPAVRTVDLMVYRASEHKSSGGPWTLFYSVPNF